MDILNRFSSWFKLKRAVALATKYISILRTKVAQKRTSQEPVATEKESSKSVLVEDLEQAECPTASFSGRDNRIAKMKGRTFRKQDRNTDEEPELKARPSNA